MSRLTAPLLGLAALLCAGCARPSRPNIILVVVDTLRADALGCYGGPRRTPAIDQIAAEGVRFEHVVAQAPWTYPSLASILTSQYPYEHGIGVTVRGAARGRTQALPETLRGHGYRTAAFSEISCSLLQRANFESCSSPEADWTASERSGSELTFLGARRWLEANTKAPFFLMIHTYEAHDYFAIAPHVRDHAIQAMPDYNGRFRQWSVRNAESAGVEIIDSLLGASASDIAFVRALYQAAVTRVDEEIGTLDRLLATRSLQRDTVLVVTSDHGEGFDPGLKRLHHGGRLHEDLLHVPLIIRWKGHVGPGVVKGVVEAIDIAPTFLSLLQANPEPSHRGRALLTLGAPGGSLRRPAFLPSPPTAPRAFSEESAWLVEASGRRVLSTSRQFAVHSPPHKLISVGDRLELYDLSQDPQETVNIVGSHPDRARSILAAAHESVAPLGLDPAARKETEDVLRALGYIR